MAQAPSSSIQFGSEVYAWFMKENGRAHANRLDHMIDIIARAGFAGVQPIFSWMGDLSDPRRFAESLAARGGLTLAAMSFVLDWNHDGETDDELRKAESVLKFLGNFPGALLCVVQMMKQYRSLINHVHLYEGAGHAFHWECIEDFNPRVRTWLRAH